MAPLDFDRATLTWVDQDGFDDELNRRRKDGRVVEKDADLLRDWHRDGYAYFPGAASGAEVDAMIADYERYWQERPAGLKVLCEGRGVTPIAEMPSRSELGHHHYRLLDVQDISEAARRLILLPRITSFLRHVFDETPVAMQSLLFEYGSEQGTHQDFPYVQARILSRLVGCWIALEDVREDNGPLFYYPGSHRIPKFDWGGGHLEFDGKNEKLVDDFGHFLEESCEKAGLERLTFHAKKGDVFLWHAALVHGGSPTLDPNATRLSLVAHFSSVTAYPRDRRFADVEPRHYERNGGLIYQEPVPPLLAKLKRKVKKLLGRG